MYCKSSKIAQEYFQKYQQYCMLWMNPAWYCLIWYRQLSYSFIPLKPVHADLSPVCLITIRPCFTDPVEPLPFYSLKWEKALHSTSPQIDRLAFPSLIFASDSQTLHHAPSLRRSPGYMSCSLSYVLLYELIGTAVSDGFVSTCLLAGRAVPTYGSCICTVCKGRYWASGLGLYLMHSQNLLPHEYNGSKYLRV